MTGCEGVWDNSPTRIAQGCWQDPNADLIWFAVPCIAMMGVQLGMVAS